jgi:hypothetical protein
MKKYTLDFNPNPETLKEYAYKVINEGGLSYSSDNPYIQCGEIGSFLIDGICSHSDAIFVEDVSDDIQE